MIKIDDKQIKEYEKDLKAFAHRAFPFATKNTINKAAFTAQEISRDFIKGKMVERNGFTRQSIQVERSRTLVVSRQEAIVGSIAHYMEDQEFGGIRRKTGKHGVAIPTPASSGEGERAIPRRKLPRKANKLQNIRLRKARITAKTRKQRNKILISEAAQAGGRNRFIFLDLGRRSGIFRVTGGKRRPKIVKMHDISRSAVIIPKRPWLKPAVDITQGLLPTFYRHSLEFQLKRFGLFRGH